jgi:archaemetzincin
MMIFQYLYLLLAVTFLSCFQTEDAQGQHKVVRIQPLGDISPDDVNALTDSIKRLFPKVVVSAPKKLPAFAYYRPRGRYKADSLLKYLSSIAQPNETVIGLTRKDISTKSRTHADWGIMGLGRCPGNACVASTFRLNIKKKKSQFYKVAIHELGHTFGLPHCRDLYCYMRAAEGGNPTDDEKYFCKKCSNFLKGHHWKL